MSQQGKIRYYFCVGNRRIDELIISRRDFSKATIGAGATLAVAGRASFALPNPLIYRTIPSSGEKIPVLGVGTNRYGVGADAELRAPLKAALAKFHELGGTVIDTAPGYRTSEKVLGELIAQLGVNDDLFIATKVDVEGRDESAQRMHDSFSRLNRSRMDLMQVHDFRGWEESIPLMQEWKAEGHIRYVGITTSRASQYDLMEHVMKKFDLDFVQVNLSIANQRTSADRILPLAGDRGTAVLVNRPFGGGGVFGLLSKTTIPDWAEEIEVSSWAQFLLKYVLSHSQVTCAIPGMTKERHVVDNFGAAVGILPSLSQRAQMEAFFDTL